MIREPVATRTSVSRRITALAVTLVAVGLSGYPALATTTRWLVTGAGTGFGLRTYEACSTYGCDLRPAAAVVTELGRTNPALVQSGFVEAGVVTTIAVWSACGLLLLAVLPALAGVRARLAGAASRLALFALVVALAGAVAFMLRRPGGTGAGAFAIGPSFWIFGAGNVLGLIAGQMLARLHGPADPG